MSKEGGGAKEDSGEWRCKDIIDDVHKLLSTFHKMRPVVARILVFQALKSNGLGQHNGTAASAVTLPSAPLALDKKLKTWTLTISLLSIGLHSLVMYAFTFAQNRRRRRRNAGIDTACSRDLRRARRAKTQMETEPQTENLVTETPFNEQVLSLEHYPPFNKGAWSWRCESHVCVALMKSDFSLASVVHLVRTRIRATSIDRLFH